MANQTTQAAQNANEAARQQREAEDARKAEAQRQAVQGSGPPIVTTETAKSLEADSKQKMVPVTVRVPRVVHVGSVPCPPGVLTMVPEDALQNYRVQQMVKAQEIEVGDAPASSEG